MGMALYDSSPVAKDIWQRADRHFLENYGRHYTSCNCYTTFYACKHRRL